MTFLNKTKHEDLQWLLNECSKHITIDHELAISTVKNHFGIIKKKLEPHSDNQIIRLEKKWYKSLQSSPDYSVYSDPFYICDIWVCWALYSNKSIKAIINKKALGDKSVVDSIGGVKTVLDLGCGFGFTTACLAEIFKGAEVYGTNLPDTFQYKICEKISKQSNFKIFKSAARLKNVDVIFASEYFEHIENSLKHLYEIICQNSPRMLVVANGYNGHAIGHFNKYIYQGKTYSAKQTSYNFGKMMRFLGYDKLKTKIWNNRPAVWVKR
tara:strand:- start:282 stop:1085 length:804 start_codon:yes stop_codon:yes gene_type:complete